jgi:hypothetical protein
MFEEDKFHVEMFREATGSTLRVPVPEDINKVMQYADPNEPDESQLVMDTMAELVMWYMDNFANAGWECVRVFNGLVD